MTAKTELETFPPDAEPLIVSVDNGHHPTESDWVPICRSLCDFNPHHFDEAMRQVIRQPNLLSTWLFRADVLFESDGVAAVEPTSSLPAFENQPQVPRVKGLLCRNAIVRKLIPRSIKRDPPLLQTCIFYVEPERTPGTSASLQKSLVIYLPHVASESEVPYYHPRVRAVGILHEWDMDNGRGTFSVHYQFFNAGHLSPKLVRTALNLLSILHKLGQGQLNGYTKRVHHDRLVPQSALQDRYTALRDKHGRELVSGWLEATNPLKHVFEDLCIAAFLIELWADMYKDSTFPGFVDIGCGNGLLVSILNKEGFRGWGFDARSRKSWAIYNGKRDGDEDSELLRQMVLLPFILKREAEDAESTCCGARQPNADIPISKIHNGIFPSGTFIISNHADELTAWTPILAAASACPFIAIPCCSHNLTGAKFRAPRPRDKSKPASTYSSFVSWVSDITADCGWVVETEVLRIPSTRNIAIIGRRREEASSDLKPEQLEQIIYKYGGAGIKYQENAFKLFKTTGPASH